MLVGHAGLEGGPCLLSTKHGVALKRTRYCCCRLIALARQHGKDHEASGLLFQKV